MTQTFEAENDKTQLEREVRCDQGVLEKAQKKLHMQPGLYRAFVCATVRRQPLACQLGD